MNFNAIQETSSFLASRISAQPAIGIILGSGLGSLAGSIRIRENIPYNQIPHFPQSTVEGHKGELLFGEFGGKEVVMMSGRFHYYEGRTMQEVTFPIRVMKALGVETLILSNAAGGMNPDFAVGDIMLIKDHINLFPEHPLRGPNDSRLGIRFPDMSEPYSKEYLEKVHAIAGDLDIALHEGVYVGLQGPTFETRAEYRFLHTIGGDAVGMSTVPEVIVANHAGMKVFAASIITDLGIRDELNTITHEEVLQAADNAAPKLSKLVEGLVRQL